MIKCNQHVRNIKITQLADDTTIFLKNTNEIPVVINIIDEFGLISGLKLNKQKTEGILLGKSKHENECVIHDTKFSAMVKALGTYVGINSAKCEELNWNDKIVSCQKVINSWNNRNLTFYGRVTVIKTLLIPKFIYLLQSTFVSKNIINELNTMCFKFLWNNKTEKNKRSILIGNKQDGGIEMPDMSIFAKTLKMKLIKMLCIDDNANWKVIPIFFLNQYGKKLLIFKMNIDSFKSLPKVTWKIPAFYEDIICNFIEMNNVNTPKKTQRYFDIRTEVIWGNRYIKHNGKCLIFENWINSNIIFINDLLSNTGLAKETHIISKLENKSNWIAELNKLKISIPKDWTLTLQ